MAMVWTPWTNIDDHNLVDKPVEVYSVFSVPLQTYTMEPFRKNSY